MSKWELYCLRVHVVDGRDQLMMRMSIGDEIVSINLFKLNYGNATPLQQFNVVGWSSSLSAEVFNNPLDKLIRFKSTFYT